MENVRRRRAPFLMRRTISTLLALA
ncbi:MAG: hypothetical protein QOE08_2086, partial [Thermoleophilaceae bacterium]|nr:hypothetical protein [Thermoleophilaceae bacterium]